MTFKDFLALVIFVEVVLIISMFIWFMPAIIERIKLEKRRKKFAQELTRLFGKINLDRTQIEVLSKEFSLSSKDVQLALRWAFKEELSSNQPVFEKVEYLQSIFQDYERDEPFEGLPSDVRLHLERLRELIGKDSDHMLQPLASKLQELNDENVKKNLKLKRQSVVSLMIGVTSLVFAIYSYYIPAA
ncbi:hypothetical protein [Thiomicrorhabdus sp.]|uniref:hypothetical protein n=1 Tax=Thiomicrorhabdus sp. TaxID=2039724 RepID=UPI0035670502